MEFVLFAAAVVSALVLEATATEDGAVDNAAPGLAPLVRPFICTQVPSGAKSTESPLSTSWEAGGELPRGSRIALVDPSDPRHPVSVLTDGFSSAGRADLSFDASRLLFVGKREADEPVGVWEMELADRKARRITDCVGGCAEAIYLGEMFDRRSDQPYRQIAFRSSPSETDPGSLFTCRVNGAGARRVTFQAGVVSDPLLLSDGRLLFSLSSLGQGTMPRADGWLGDSLMTVNTDGTDLFPFAAVHEPPAFRSMSCETSDGRIVYVESDHLAGGGGNRLVAVPRTRSLKSRRVLASASDGVFHSPSALPDGGLLVSYKANGDDNYGVYRMGPNDESKIVKVFDDPAWHDVAPILVEPRREPPGRSSVVDERSSSGQLYGLDVYLSDLNDGREVPRGRIKRLRVIQAVGVVDEGVPLAVEPGGAAPAIRRGTEEGDAVAVRERVLGEAPVEDDGSFFLDVPARTPLRVETLDGDGQVVRGMRSYFWVMPNERRGCIGCHEDRELTPPNRHVLALRRRASRLLAAEAEAATLADPRPHSPSER